MPAWSELPHALTTAAIAIEYVTVFGTEWIAESMMPTGEHRPDGIAVKRGRQVAVEVERNTKSAARWQAILSHLLSDDRYARIHYWTTPATGAALTRWIQQNLTPSNQALIAVQPIGRWAR